MNVMHLTLRGIKEIRIKSTMVQGWLSAMERCAAHGKDYRTFKRCMKCRISVPGHSATSYYIIPSNIEHENTFRYLLGFNMDVDALRILPNYCIHPYDDPRTCNCQTDKQTRQNQKIFKPWLPLLFIYRHKITVA